MLKISELRARIGRKLANTNLGVLIIANSYIFKSYNWYRALIYESDHSLEEIRDLMKADDRIHRWDWLIARARATHIHCNHAELCEMLGYITADIDEFSEEKNA